MEGRDSVGGFPGSSEGHLGWGVQAFLVGGAEDASHLVECRVLGAGWSPAPSQGKGNGWGEFSMLRRVNSSGIKGFAVGE